MSRATSPTVDDVAKLAGVSTATVSRCLNNPERVVPTTRAKVEAAVDALGYTPNFGGRLLASRRSSTIGAVIPTMENAIFARGIQAFQEALAQSSVTLLVSTSCYDAEREFDQIRTLVSQGAEGLMLIGISRPQKSYEFLQMRKIPYVLTWNHRQDDEHLYVGFDNFAAMYEMTQAVIARGHERIALMVGPSAHNDRIQDRVAGAHAAMRDAGLQHPIVKSARSNYAPADAGDAFADLMSLSQRPTVVMCGNDVLAVGAIMRARKMGVRIPDDVSITGFDDIDLAEIVDPPLTTVHVPHRRMGEAAARILLELREGHTDRGSDKIETHLVMRDSLQDRP